MFKIYRQINETWVITNRNLQELINRPINVAHISKSGIAFTDVDYNFRLGFSSASQKKEKCLCMDFSINDSKTTANISLYFKATNSKRSFENVTCQSEMTDLPFKLFMDEIKDGKCEIEIKGIFIIERDGYPIIPRSINIDYGLLENTKKDFDIIIASENGKEENIKIHKDVLSFQSPVFEAMFKSGMKESITNTLKIIDFNFTTVIAAIEFFYGHQIFNHFNFKELFELYRFADKYLIDDLMDYITLFISYRISPLNVVEIYNLAVASNSLMKIKDQCFDFLVFCKNENIPVENSDSVILKN
uniref:BTB domain-containing protein n=1 Tax=Panagrolaimus davidi TaxID=227884 RepID=A0A914P0R5_9BILA